MATPGYCWRRSNGLLLFGLTTAFLFAMAQICGLGSGAGVFWGLKELG